MAIKLYNARKRDNSTKVPTDYLGDVSLIWEQPYDVVNPSFHVNGRVDNRANYCHVEELGRYYWINTTEDMRRNDEYYLVCTSDPMATFRDDILDSTFFVALNENTFNTKIFDGRLIGLNQNKITTVKTAMPNISSNPFEHYMLQILGDGAGGFAASYILAPTALEQLAKKALTDTTFIAEYACRTLNAGIEGGSWSITKYCKDIIENIGGLIDNAPAMLGGVMGSIIEGTAQPYQNIIMLRTLPVKNVNIFTGTIENVKLGQLDSGIGARRVTNPVSQVNEFTMQIPWYYSDFRRCNRYTELYLYFPFVGIVPLDVGRLLDSNSLTFSYTIGIDGSLMGVINDDKGNFVTDIGCTMGAQMATGSRYAGTSDFGMINTFASMFGGVGAGVGQMAMGNVGGISTLFETASNSITSVLSAQQHVRGADNTANVYSTDVVLICKSLITKDPNTLKPLGRELEEPRVLNTLSGYTVCRNASIECNATLQEIETINGYLNGGFYIE